MEADIRWLDTPEVFRVNQMAAHSDHIWFGDESCYQAGMRHKDYGTVAAESDLFQNLNGIWDFRLFPNAKEALKAQAEIVGTQAGENIPASDEDSAWDEIAVPCHIEMAGYDKIQYVNIQYPWEGCEYRRPPLTDTAEGQREDLFSGAQYNPVGYYRLCFDLDEKLRGKQVSLFFEGVEQAVYVWLNGVFIGYAEDSFTPSEFDLSNVIKDTGNTLIVRVHKQGCSSFLEDQDFFRFFGIFRDVSLRAKPSLHIEDLWIQPEYKEIPGKKNAGSVSVHFRYAGNTEGARLSIRILDAEGKTCLTTVAQAEQVLHYDMPEPVKLWEHRSPCLYRMELRLFDDRGELLEIVPYDFGFRRVEIVDKGNGTPVIELNGRRLIICGVNRHEWSAQGGRCIGEKERKWDMECFRRNHINAVRTCHYPDQIPWYYLCDREGIYVMAETNLETHGSWGKLDCIDGAWAMPGSFPAWEAVTLDRAKTNFEVLKNHPSILFWSLGNESFAGTTLEKMNRFYKEQDPGRLVHYEGVFFCPEYRDTISDVESRMYAPPAEIHRYLTEEAEKPFLLCEYMHDMGNSLGGMQSYMQLIDEFPSYQGGFIWDYIDQAIQVEDEVTGKPVLRYGGDFDDRPADYEFSGNGIVFADRSEKPAMQEVRYQYGRYES